METIQAIILMCFWGLAAGAGLLPDSTAAGEGGKVTFNISSPSIQTKLILITWQIETNNIITYTGDAGNITAPEYEGRITLFISDGSLELRDVTFNDNGAYRVTIIPEGFPQRVGTTTLQVQAKVTQTSVRVSSSDLVENSSVTLSCSASGSSLSFLWLNGSSEVTSSDRVNLTDGGATLTIVKVSRYDQGLKCQVSNSVSSSSSEPVYFRINYGPDNLKIMGGNKLYAGQSLELMCSVESEPVTYTWMLNDKKISDGSVLQKDTTDKSDSGKYVCVAKNSVTGKSLSGEHSLSIQDTPLSPGAIAGIVIGLMVLEGIVFGIIIYLMRKKRSNNGS